MKSVTSEKTFASVKTQQVFDSLIARAQTKIPLLNGQIDEDSLTKTWGAFGLYLSRQLRMGRGISIPHFGTFTFTAPECNLSGVTNPIERDKQYRDPVFLVSREFVLGWSLKTGIFINGHLRPYNVQTNGTISTTKINFTEISQYANTNKETVKIAFGRVVRQLADQTRAKNAVDMEIPGIGVFQVRNGVVAVHFDQFLVESVKGVPKRPLSERKRRGEMNLTADRLAMLENASVIDSNTQAYLKNTLGVDIDTLSTKSRPATAVRNLSAATAENLKKTLLRPASSNTLTRQSAINLQQPELGPLEYSLKRLKLWIRQNNYNAQDAFLEMCNNALGRTRAQKVKVNYKQFFEAVNKMELELSQEQAQELFIQLDENKDGFISYLDWKNTIKDDNEHLFYIKDVIYKRKLHTDDVLKTMGLDREHAMINILQLKESLKKLDLTLTDSKALKVAKSILGPNEFISMQDLAHLIDCQEEDDKIFDPSWFKDILFKIKQKINSLANPSELRQSFENYDEHNEGILDTANFKTCLMRSQLKLTVKEINRVVRYIPKVNLNNIDYYAFLKLVERVDINASAPDAVSDINEFANKLAKFIKDKKFTIPSFLKTVRRFSFVLDASNAVEQFVSLQQMGEFLQRNVFKGNDRLEIDYYVNELDVDCDGFIKDNDVDLFIQRYTYFDQTAYVPGNLTRTLTLKSLDPRTTSLNTKPLYPFKPLSENKVDNVLRDLRIKMLLKKMSTAELFQLLDADNDGFLTISEFSENIDKVIKLSQAAKDGFFAYMDKLHIGMVDFNSFLKIMRKSVVTKEQIIKEDNFEWENEIIFRIREWFRKEGITVEDSFRAIDQNFHREISVDDLEVFLKDCLKIKAEELSKAKLDRLFKLIDQYKRGRVSFVDWKRFILEDFTYGLNKTVMGGKKIDNYSSFDWKLNARQQLGLILTRRFASLTQSFDVISGYRKKLVFAHFVKWVHDTDGLRGFDLTDRLMQELFADLDPHKKGHLTESDWENAFEGYDWEVQMHDELKEYFQQNFQSIEKAYEFFCGKGAAIEENSFDAALNSILPKRFVESDKKDLWNYLAQGAASVEFPRFKLIFQKYLPHYMKPSDFNQEGARPKTAGPLVNLSQSMTRHLTPKNWGGATSTTNKNGLSTGSALRNNSAVQQSTWKNNNTIASQADMTQFADESNDEKLLSKIRRLLRPTIKSINAVLDALDVNKSGFITNLEFRNAIKTLNLGLTQTEVDLLLNVCEIDGRVDIKQFEKFVAYTQSDKKIVERSILKLREITNQVYTFLLSPKDAFRMFDFDSKGIITFDAFTAFVEKLAQLSGQEMPPYSIIKDIFEYIDQKRDGVIDQSEWMNIFNKFQYVPQASIKKTLLSLANEDNLRQRPQTAFNKASLTELPKNKFNLEFTSSNYPLTTKHEKGHYGIPDKEKYGSINHFFDEVERMPEAAKVQDNTFNKILGEWGKTREFDSCLIAIGKNRRFLLEMFNSLIQRQIPITFDRAKAIISQMLTSSGHKLKEEAWPILLKFAERNGLIDYKFLLEVYKERIKRIDAHPIILRNRSLQRIH